VSSVPSPAGFTFSFVKPETRRAIAYIAGRLISKTHASAIYDYSANKYASIDGTVADQPMKVDVYDYDAGCHVTGSGKDLYHYGNSAYIELKLHGKRFEGYDYDSSNFFEGEVAGRDVTLYDYGSGYFSYSL
jgi:hypothetical protein